MLYTFNSLIGIALQLRDTFAGNSNHDVEFVALTYSKENDNIHLLYYSDIDLVTPFRKEDIILVCYYAPKGDWAKWYGDEWCWNLSVKRIALDIYTNCVSSNNFFPFIYKNVLPSWLLSTIELYI